jgi:ABC transporter DrrB family efflux protein
MRNLFTGWWSIALKEIMHIRRDRVTLVFSVAVPMFQLVIFGYAIDFQVRHVRTVVVDQDRSRESREYLASLENTRYLDVVGAESSPERAADALRSGRAKVAVIVPPDFARRSGTGVAPQVRVLIDGSDSQVGNAARLALARPPANARPEVDARVNLLYNPDARTAVFTVPGLVGVILQLVTVTLSSFSLVRERESGTLDQLMVTPVGRGGLMVGKLLPYAVLASLEFVGVVFLARVVFDVPIVGNVFLLAALAVLFVVASLAIGMLISTVAKNQATALQFALLTLLPSILLSGYIAPRSTLPPPLALVSNFIPVTHFIEISRGIMVRGAGLRDLLPAVLWLLGISVALLALATLQFRKTAE